MTNQGIQVTEFWSKNYLKHETEIHPNGHRGI